MTLTLTRAPRPASTELTPARRRLALLAIALGGFGIGGSEFVSMGLLPGIAHGLLPEMMAADPEDGIARAGIAITAYALGVVVGAPALALLSVRWSRTTMIMLLAIALAVGTLLSGVMPTFELTVLARFVAGIPHGAYFGVASLLAASLMGPGSQGKGTALALSGLTVANLIGVPILTAVGQAAGWRVVYLLLAGVFVATFAALYLTVPHQEKPIGRRMVDELVALKRLQLWIVIGIAAVGFSGAFAVFSYVADITTQVTGAPESSVPWVLAAAGLGMTIGNVVGGVTTDRSLRGTLLIGFPLYITALVALFAVAHTSLTALIIAFFAANLVNSSLSPAMQTWMIRIAHRSELLGASMNQAAFNVANALGATLGGAVIAAGFGYEAPMVVAIVLASTGFAMVVTTLIALKVRSRRTLQVLSEHEETITGSIPVVPAGV
ncbi:arabinose ABC transporter permease [Brachybacterium sp. HMSC06H03]|uniref:MFS transporter n=1 Tax=Brachybacterium sp. HMSC06H03 TaxID=1581127 RepID=UPI0008A62653|nr:MFS transporter [Brachybacterium sp. HMSC06H03]OFT53199.1 arabinose ABC transporter permease [Brachybacterium sp. HMSC06H03]